MHDQAVYLAAFCANLPQMREVMRRSGGADALDAAITAVREGTPVLDVLPGLGIAPHVLTGTDATSRDWVLGGGVTHGMRPTASGEAYRCPDGSCALKIVREPGGPLPANRCWLHNLPLAVDEA